MRDFMKNSKRITLVLLLAMVLEIFSPFMGMVVEAKNWDKIVDSLEIIGGKKEKYKPGETIAIKGEWSLPDDTRDKTWKKGDGFNIAIPKGLEVKPLEIQFKDRDTGLIYGVGNYDETSNQYKFVFTEEIEGRRSRKGGFVMQFVVGKNDGPGNSEVPLDFIKDGGENLGAIVVKPGDQGVVDPGANTGKPITEDLIVKGSYRDMDYSTGRVRWYIRVNYSGKHLGPVNVKDQIGDNHRLVPGTLKVYERFTNGTDVFPAITGPDGEDKVNVTEMLDIKSWDKGFEFTGATYDFGNGIKSYYEIEYSTEYDGSNIADEKGQVKLKNIATANDVNREVNTEADEKYSHDQWGSGLNGRVKLNIKKVDSNTGASLSGAKFNIKHQVHGNVNFTIEELKDKPGIYSVRADGYGDEVLEGLYEITEVKAPEGYIKLKEPMKFVVKGTGSEIFELVIENDPIPEIKPALIDIEVKKEWMNIAEVDEKPEVLIVLENNSNKEVIEAILSPNSDRVIFRDLPKYVQKNKVDTEEKIKYSVKELININNEWVEVNEDNKGKTGYNSKVEGNPGAGFTITNTKVNEPKGSFKLKKVDSEDKKILSGAEFTLTKDSDNEFEKVKVTGENGVLEFNDLPQGNYTLKETQAPKGYVKSEEVIEIEVKEDGKVEVKEDGQVYINEKELKDNLLVVENKKEESTEPEPSKISLLIKKIASDTGNAIKGVLFELEKLIVADEESDEEAIEESDEAARVLTEDEKATLEAGLEDKSIDLEKQIEENNKKIEELKEELLKLEQAKEEKTLKSEEKTVEKFEEVKEDSSDNLDIAKKKEALEEEIQEYQAGNEVAKEILQNTDENSQSAKELKTSIRETDSEIEKLRAKIKSLEDSNKSLKESKKDKKKETLSKAENLDLGKDGETLKLEEAIENLEKENKNLEEKIIAETDGQGKISFEDLEPGKYVLREKEAAKGFKNDLEGKEIKIEIKEDGKVVILGGETLVKEINGNKLTIENTPDDPKPVKPEDPTDPEPTDPEPTDPTEPEKPTVPEKPVVEEPEKPEKPTVPERPVVEEPEKPEKPTVPEKPVVEEPEKPEKPTVPEEPIVDEPEEPAIGDGEIANDDDDSHIMGDSAETEDNNSHIEDQDEDHDSSVKGDSENNSNSPILPKTGEAGKIVFILLGLLMIVLGIKLNKKEA